jgi:hypothetical protein
MKASHRMLILAGLLALAPAGRAGAVEVSTFEDLGLAANSYYFPAATTSFTSGPASFNHDYSSFGTPGCCWVGWTYSSTTDGTTPGDGNQYSAFPGSGAGGSATYGVAFFGTPVVEFAVPGTVQGGYFTNTTYTALSMLNGDSFAKKFGGASGNDPDFLKLTIVGRSETGAVTGAVDFYLADYRFADRRLDYIVSSWTFVDLAALGIVKRLEFALASSDAGRFGINTPTYFALDNLSIAPVPEPATVAMLLAGLAGLAAARRRSMA